MRAFSVFFAQLVAATLQFGEVDCVLVTSFLPLLLQAAVKRVHHFSLERIETQVLDLDVEFLGKWIFLSQTKSVRTSLEVNPDVERGEQIGRA